MRTALFVIALLLPTAVATAQSPNAGLTPKQRKEKILAGYRAVNDRHIESVQLMMDRQQFFAMQQRDEMAKVAASRPRVVVVSPRSSSSTSKPREDPYLRRDVSGPYGTLGAPGLRAYSKDIRTGQLIPSDMIPKGYGSYYTTVSPR